MRKEKGMGRIVYVLCFLLLLQAVSFPVFADPLNTEGEIDTLGLSDNSNLSNLTIANGFLLPAFSPDQTEYVVVGDGSHLPITVTGTTEDTHAAISFTGPPEFVQLGVNQGLIPPLPREASLDIDVTAEDRSTKTYTLKVNNSENQTIDPMSLLGNLRIRNGSLTPVFNPECLNYAVVVGNEVSMISVIANAIEPSLDVYIYAPTMPMPLNMRSGGADPIGLNVGFNRLTIDVLGQTISTYSISVFRQAAPPVVLSSNKDLSALTFSEGALPGTLSPEFHADTKTYTATVASGTEGISVTATPADSKANVSIDGGPASKMVRLNEESATIIPILVTAEDGSDQTYTLTVTKAAPAPVVEKNNLGSLVVSGGTLYPAFSPDQTEYLIVANPQIEFDPNSGRVALPRVVKVTTAPASEGTIVRVADIKGNMRAAMIGGIMMAQDGTIQIEFHPDPDDLLFRFDVTPQVGDRKSYTIKVVTEMPEPVKLSGLTTSLGTLDPIFDPETIVYATTVAHETRAITVAGLVDDINASVSVNGKSASEVIALVEKETKIEIVVTAEYQTDHKTYTLTVTKAEPTPLSSNNDLSGLVVSQGSLTPGFDAGETSYAVRVARSVTSLTVTGTLADEKASMTVNGLAVTSGTVSMPIELLEESTIIPIVVTAEDGLAKTYTVSVNKEAKIVPGRFHHLVAERTFGGQTLARFDDLCFGLIIQKDENGLIDYRVPLRSKAKDVRLQIPYADLIARMGKGARDLLLNYQGHEINIPMTSFEGDWLEGIPAGTDSTFEIHLQTDEAGQTTYTIDFFVIEQIDGITRLVHRKSVQK
ncbi:hypothetical protein SANA_29290 [Gottschalkiaceae bacterium SANA]|nr:hypothetical protein SANA_29290 [Gottschalkiaceae bacterium SANA]